MKGLLTFILILSVAWGCATPHDAACRKKYLATLDDLDADFERWQDKNVCSFETNDEAVTEGYWWLRVRYVDAIYVYGECIESEFLRKSWIDKFEKNPEVLKRVRTQILHYRGNFCK